MKKSPEKYSELCDALVIEPFYETAARKIGTTATTIFRWLGASQQNPAEYTFTWGEGGDVAPLHVHVKTAMRMNAHLIEAQARKFALDGFEEPVFFQGKQCWKEDERKASLKSDEWSFVDGHDDPYLRDENGNRVPLTVRHKPSDALVAMVLRAAFPKVYGQSVDVNHNVSGGVTILKRSAEAKPPPPVRDMRSAEEKLADLRARQNGETVDAEFTEAAPEPEAAQAPPDPFAPSPGDSPAVADLKAKARELRDHGPKNPLPSHHVHVHRDIPEPNDLDAAARKAARAPSPQAQAAQPRRPGPIPPVMERPAYARPSPSAGASNG